MTPIWYLVWMLIQPDGFIERYQPMTSQTACDTARQGVKFAPIESVSTIGQGGGAVGESPTIVAVYCAQLGLMNPVVTYPELSP